MNIVVTGGAGFIGSHVVKILLDESHQVVVLDNLSSSKKETVDKRAELIVGDIKDPIQSRKALKGTDAVIHMAGLVIVPESVKDPVKYCENNVIGTMSFLG